MKQAKVWKNLLLFLEGNLVGSNTSESKSVIATNGIPGRFPCYCECGSEAVFLNTKAAREWLDEHASHTAAGWPVVDFTYVRESDLRKQFERSDEDQAVRNEAPISDRRAILERIRKLQRLAANNPERKEASSAANKAAELRAKYGSLLNGIE